MSASGIDTSIVKDENDDYKKARETKIDGSVHLPKPEAERADSGIEDEKDDVQTAPEAEEEDGEMRDAVECHGGDGPLLPEDVPPTPSLDDEMGSFNMSASMPVGSTKVSALTL